MSGYYLNLNFTVGLPPLNNLFPSTSGALGISTSAASSTSDISGTSGTSGTAGTVGNAGSSSSLGATIAQPSLGVPLVDERPPHGMCTNSNVGGGVLVLHLVRIMAQAFWTSFLVILLFMGVMLVIDEHRMVALILMVPLVRVFLILLVKGVPFFVSLLVALEMVGKSLAGDVMSLFKGTHVVIVKIFNVMIVRKCNVAIVKMRNVMSVRMLYVVIMRTHLMRTSGITLGPSVVVLLVMKASTTFNMEAFKSSVSTHVFFNNVEISLVGLVETFATPHVITASNLVGLFGGWASPSCGCFCAPADGGQ